MTKSHILIEDFLKFCILMIFHIWAKIEYVHLFTIEQECQRLTEVLLKRETRIKEIIESS